MTSVRLESCFLRAGATFKKPLLFWSSEVPLRFFQAVYDSLNELLHIQPSDFSAPGGGTLGDCSAALRIFGGDSTLTLKSNGIIAEFPSLAPDRIEFANSVIIRGYQAFREEFNELEIKSIESNAGYHFEIIDDVPASSLLGVNVGTILQQRSKKIRSIVLEPAVRFRLVSEDGKWSVVVSAEKSERMKNGIFLLRQIVVSDLVGYETIQQQFELVESIDHIILELLDFNFDLPSSDAN